VCVGRGGSYSGMERSFVMSDGVVSGNTASNGGGVFVGFDCSFVMSGGAISDNAVHISGAIGSGSGGGVYAMGSFMMEGGEISCNTANTYGGGVWVTDTSTNLDRFMVPEYAIGVVFSGNRASVGYNIAPAHVPVYDAYIQGEVVSWSAPFNQGYNNYDISYTATGEACPSYSVTVIDSNVPITGAGNYVVGFNVNINAGFASEGEEFKTWETSSEGVYFADAKSAVTTFYMPDHDVTVKHVNCMSFFDVAN